jgi:predicted lipoprotein with Yx(FWY)xxD motif
MTQRNYKTFLAAVAAVPLAVLAVTGCGGATASPAHPTTKDGRPATIGVAKEGLGKILVNSQGRTLYLFKKDTGTMSTCTGACAVNWPPLRAKGKPTVGNGASASLVSTTMRPGGTSQVTYNGHPLYRFANDKKAGDTNGEGLTAFGGSWFAISGAGNQVSPQTSSPGGYGY